MGTSKRLRHRRRKRPNGFTLIELLAVVAIIAILLAILVLSLGRARDAAKRTLCQANLRQLAAAWHMYLDDHGGQFLQGRTVAVNYGGRQGRGMPSFAVPKPLNRYLGLPAVVTSDRDAAVFHCPADRGGGFIRPSHFDFQGTSYLMNHMLVGQDELQVSPGDPCRDEFRKVSDRLPNLNESMIADSDQSKLMLMGDSGWKNAWEYDKNPKYHFDWHKRPSVHNLAFMDGHAAFVKIRKGYSVTPQYSIVSFKDLQKDVEECQECPSRYPWCQ